ncbi:Putative phosphate transport regulator [Methanocaldococcus vulcanius M7]|uniref:Phosphate transport regulator n=1 Tax=Methanocaldococcus vulcanius (strain ATCC 700851 / DSM 12094 / M7) TaxID=579137 RepID=C9RDM6_METVM|nr:TIGR00153 family protein [Methanocaldococcus vulcanius]ACX73405.1 Putative phosphate transport regulator [Methanocaldococcus vulcanius M7]
MSIFFFERNSEKNIINNLRLMIQKSLKGLELLKYYMKTRDKKILAEIIKIEEEGDEITKTIRINLEEAFLPNMRRELSRSAELLDETLDSLKHAAMLYELLKTDFDEYLNNEITIILKITVEMFKYLEEVLNIIENGGTLDPTIKEIKDREKFIDDIYQNRIYKYLINLEVKSFWEGKIICDFIDNVVNISDYIEDVADELHIIYLHIK